MSPQSLDAVAHRHLYVLRHGETDWNAAQRWQGHTDIPLNDAGRLQAHQVAQALRALRPVGIVSSDLARATETARIIAAELGIPFLYADAGLRERSFGCFEGLTREQCETQHAEAWSRWLSERHPPAGGESHDALTERMVAAIERVASGVARPGAPALVVTHGGSLRALVKAVTGHLPAPIRNAAVWRVTWNGGVVGAEEV